MHWSSHLVNPPGGDPALYLSLPNRQEAFLIDCGDLSPLRLKDLLRVRRLFVTHTHIDHFIGFDQLLRAQLFSATPLDIYGPPGLAEQVAGKLNGYAWNLVEDSPFRLLVHELHPDHLASTEFLCRERFKPETRGEAILNPGLCLKEGPVLSFSPVHHNVACLAFRLEWPPGVRVNKKRLAELNLVPGPWLKQLKEHPQQDPELAVQVLEHSPRAALAYVTDTLLDKTTAGPLQKLVREADELWCEACYLNEHLEKARAHLHLTARQAARLARDAKVKKLYLFHFSRRYASGKEHLEEARAVFPEVEPAPVYPAL